MKLRAQLHHLKWIVFPVLAIALFVIATAAGTDKVFPHTALSLWLGVLLLPVLFGTVFSSVHYAESIGHRIGEPYGTLVLTLAVTIIEVALIASLMLGNGTNPSLARDTVFAVIMIVCNGLVGLCILLGGIRYREQGFLVTGANAYLTVLIALATLTLVLPNYTTSVPGPIYSPRQLGYVSILTILLYLIFLYIQTIRHHDYFVTELNSDQHDSVEGESLTALAYNTLWLVLTLAGVVLLAKKFAVVVETGIRAVGAPAAVAGVVVALLILAPESIAAIRAARRDQLQNSLNLALGSTLASIGLTIPAVAAVNLALQQELVLGLAPRDTALLMLTFLISLITFGTGRTNILLGLVHLVIFATFGFLLFEPY
jgi:Ca2+:H+ antiporter